MISQHLRLKWHFEKLDKYGPWFIDQWQWSEARWRVQVSAQGMAMFERVLSERKNYLLHNSKYKEF